MLGECCSLWLSKYWERFGQCIMQIHNAECSKGGAQRVKKNFFCCNFLCLAIKYKFYFTVSPVTVHLGRASIKESLE